MTNTNIEIFNSEEFGSVRVLTLSGEPWFVGRDVASALGYSNTKDALAKHVDPEDKRIIQRSSGATFTIPPRGLTVINESGLYSLMLSCRLASGKRFKRWITAEVLPTIRKNGFYITDPLLQQHIDSGLKNNADMRIALLKVKEAEAALLSSKMTYLPSLSLGADGSVGQFKGESTPKSYSLAMSASWEIDLFGKILNEKRGAEAVLWQNTSYSQAVQTQLIATIANSYYMLLMLDEQLAISRRTSENWSDYVRTLQALKTFGTVNDAAIAQAEASQLSLEGSVLSLQQQIQSVENSLSVLLGKVPGRIERTSLDEQNFPTELSAGVPLQLLGNRPDIRQAEATLAQAYYATNVARAAFYPNISLSGTAGWTNSGGAGIVNPGGWLLNAVGSLLQPIFNRGQNIANLKIAKAQQEEALISFQQSILDAGAEVNDALTQWQTAQQRLVLDEKQIASLQRAVKSTQLLMDYGSTNYLEVLIAQQDLLQAELTMVEDKFNEIQGVINLYHALGGGKE